MTNPSDNNAAILRAQQLMQQLRLNYLDELPERVDELEQRALALKESEDFVPQFEELYRKTHSLKGTAGTYGLQIITSICHQLEESLVFIANDRLKVDDAFLDRCMVCFDLMRLAIRGAVQGKTSFPDVEQALTTMRALASDKDKRSTALLVEPSKFNCALYLGVLKNLPIRFSVVGSGYEALGLLLHKPFDLLITGFETQSLNGVALITALRLNPGVNQDIPAILLTSSSGIKIPLSAQPVSVLSRDEHIGEALHNDVQGCLGGVLRPNK